MDPAVLIELKRRIASLRGDASALPDDEQDDSTRRLEARLSMVQRIIEARVPDRRLWGASISACSGRAAAIAKEAAAGRSWYIHGSKGAGKSFVAVAAMRLRLEQLARSVTAKETEADRAAEVDDLWSQSVQYVSHDVLLRDLKAAIRNDGDPDDVLSRYADAAWLVFDDLGARTKLSQFEADETATLIDKRYTSGAATVFTTNLALHEIEAMMEAAGPHVGERAVSRIHGIYRGSGLGPDGSDLWPDAEPITVSAADRRKG